MGQAPNTLTNGTPTNHSHVSALVTFEHLRQFLTGMYFVLTILSVPSLLFAVSGEGFTEVWVARCYPVFS